MVATIVVAGFIVDKGLQAKAGGIVKGKHFTRRRILKKRSTHKNYRKQKKGRHQSIKLAERVQHMDSALLAIAIASDTTNSRLGLLQDVVVRLFH